MTSSKYRIIAGLIVVRDSITPGAQGWRRRTSRAARTRRASPSSSRRPHVEAAHGVVDLAHDDLDHAVEDLLLVGDVVVERHGLDPEPLGERAHGHRLDTGLVRELDGGAQHPLPLRGTRARRASSGSPLSSAARFVFTSCVAARLDRLTLYV